MPTIGSVHLRFRVGSDDLQFNDHNITEDDIDMARDELEDLIGDGNARVTISLGLKDADFGNGFEAFCSVTLTCNQDARSIREAADLAQDIVDERLEPAFDAAHKAYKELGPHPQATKRGK